ncbi:MAG: membrane dipeptidase, partial [Planctomycetes bacterium]|nr:membrane dipeptidase [Planctomycetota bacterium]
MPARPQPRIDGHLDLAYLALQGVDLERTSGQPEKFGVNLPALQAGGVGLVLGTIFTERGSVDAWGYPADDDGTEAERAGERQLEVYRRLEAKGAIRLVRTRRDLDAVGDGGPLHVVLLMECADPIRTPAHAARWFDAGVRVVGMAWAYG